MAVTIRFQDVVKSFGAHTVVDRISLTIKPGELFFLLGPSGCGKTTLLRCIAGFYVPEQGSIHIGDRDVTRLAPEERDTGMVFQSYALWPHMTVRENVAFGLELRKVSKADTATRVDEALAAVRMTERADYKPNQLSGGQQQRVALARALVVRPQCLLLDEPLSNLDAKLRLEMRTEIRRICKEAGLTAVYVTHDQKEALSIADRIALMHNGTIAQCGSPAEVYRKPASQFVANFIGETNFIPGTVRQAEAEGAVVSTAIGDLRSAHAPPDGIAAGQPVMVSIRPEAILLDASAADGNRLDGQVHDTIYLGETAQHQVSIANHPEVTLKVFDLNPVLIARDDEVRPCSVHIPADSVVLLKP